MPADRGRTHWGKSAHGAPGSAAQGGGRGKCAPPATLEMLGLEAGGALAVTVTSPKMPVRARACALRICLGVGVGGVRATIAVEERSPPSMLLLLWRPGIVLCVCAHARAAERAVSTRRPTASGVARHTFVLTG